MYVNKKKNSSLRLFIYRDYTNSGTYSDNIKLASIIPRVCYKSNIRFYVQVSVQCTTFSTLYCTVTSIVLLTRDSVIESNKGIKILKAVHSNIKVHSGSQSDVSSLGRYVFGSEISYNKAPPPPAWASLLNKPKSQKSLGY
jgi:hypothetical protein